MLKRTVKQFQADKRFTVESVRPEMRRPIRKVLVLGGAGYIGSGMVRDLLAESRRALTGDQASG